MSKLSIPVAGNVITDSTLLLQRIKCLLAAGSALPGSLLTALKEFVASEDLLHLFGAHEGERLQLIAARVEDASAV